MTSINQQNSVDTPSRKRKCVTSRDTPATIKRMKHVTSGDDGGSLKHHEQVGRQVTSCDRQNAGESPGKLKPSSQIRDWMLIYLP
jgi:hypothetical protein